MVKKLLLLLGSIALVMTVAPRPAHAAVSCTQNLLGCYATASMESSWWDNWNYIACELSYADCARRVVFG
jgi:hypothetical protein